jgi:hypothetical protein
VFSIIYNRLLSVNVIDDDNFDDNSDSDDDDDNDNDDNDDILLHIVTHLHVATNRS